MNDEKMRWVRSARFLVFILIAALAGALLAETAKELNSKGFRLYKQKKYEEALEYFQKAVEADPEYALAHYNLACTLAIMRQQGKTCEYDAYRDRILDHLEKSIQLDPGRKERMKTDPDLVPVHDTFRYQLLLGLSLDRTEDVKKMLTTITWWGPAPGVYGSGSGISFRPDGTMELWLLNLDDLSREKIPGRYQVSGNQINITLDNPLQDKKEFTGTLRPDGVLDLPGLFGPFSDSEDECSA